jgi:hypothetical protein
MQHIASHTSTSQAPMALDQRQARHHKAKMHTNAKSEDLASARRASSRASQGKLAEAFAIPNSSPTLGDLRLYLHTHAFTSIL